MTVFFIVGYAYVGPDPLAGDLPYVGVRLCQTRGHRRYGEGYSGLCSSGAPLQV